MLGIITVKVTAGNPRAPLSTVPVFVGSDCTVVVADVPDSFFGCSISGVTCSTTNVAGASMSVSAKRSGCGWCATFPAAFFSGAGEVRGGFKVSASGTNEDGASASWTIGVGKLDVMLADSVPAPGVTWQDVHLRDEVPDEPQKGDLALREGVWSIYTGEEWSAIGGGGGAVVESETNPGFAANADHADSANSAGVAAYATEAQSAIQAVQSVSAETVPWAGIENPPDFAEKGDLIVTMDLVEAAGIYSIQLDGEILAYSQVQELAASRNAVIRHGRGTYRPTYIGAAEMMWDCTGTVGQKVQTGTIHMFADGNVVQFIPARTLALQTALTAIGELAAYPVEWVEAFQLKDRTINVMDVGGEISFPPLRADGNTRDFLLRVPATPEAVSLIFPSTVRYESWQDAADIWTAEAGTSNEWYFSESEPGVFKVVHQVLNSVAQ